MITQALGFMGGRDRSATVAPIGAGAYRVTGVVANVRFEADYTGVGAAVSAQLAARNAAFKGKVPRPMAVRSGDTRTGLSPIEVL